MADSFLLLETGGTDNLLLEDGDDFLLEPTPENYTLTLDQGSYTYAGQATGLVYGRFIALDQGSYALTGQNVALSVGRTLVVDQGSYALTGFAVDLSRQLGILSVPSGGPVTIQEDFVYVIVNRTINGQTRRYIERFSTRQFADWRRGPAVWLDSHLTYDGRNDDEESQVGLSSDDDDWTATGEITITASDDIFTEDEIGNGITVWIPGSTATAVRITITAVDSETVARGTPSLFTPTTYIGEDSEEPEVPLLLRNIATQYWSRAVDVAAGMEHLEGRTVQILANGLVLTGTVTDGEVALGGLYDVVHVGLQIQADVETLDIDDAQSANLRAKKKIVKTVDVLTQHARQIKLGRNVGTLQLNGIQTVTTPTNLGFFGDGNENLVTEFVEVNIAGKIEKPGRVLIRQDKPEPAAVLGLIPQGDIGN